MHVFIILSFFFKKKTMCQPAAQASKALPITALLVRAFTLIFLLASLIVLATDTATFRNLASRKSLFASRIFMPIGEEKLCPLIPL